MSLIKIFCLTAHLEDGASTPRVNSIKHLEETGYPCIVKVSTQASSLDVEWADIFMIHRPVESFHVELAKMVKNLNKKLWVDNDDDQLSVPVDHPAYMQYMDPRRKEFIRETNRLADLVTISNPEILKSYKDLNTNIHYYPCAYDERLMPEPDLSPRSKRILWRGSPSSKKAMREFAPAIHAIDKKYEGWEFIFIGDYPWEMIEGITQNAWYCSTLMDTPQKLWAESRRLKPAIQIVMHVDNQFSRSRSNMGMMDASIAGAKVLAPDWPHFRIAGIENYSSISDFKRRLSSMMDHVNSGKDFTAGINLVWNYIKSNNTFKVINLKQAELIHRLMGDKA